MKKSKTLKEPIAQEAPTPVIDPATFSFDQRRMLVWKTLQQVTPSGVFEMMGVLETIKAELQEHIAKLVRAAVR